VTVKHLGGAIIDNHAANIVRIFQPDNGMNEDIVNVPTSLAKKLWTKYNGTCRLHADADNQVKLFYISPTIFIFWQFSGNGNRPKSD